MCWLLKSYRLHDTIDWSLKLINFEQQVYHQFRIERHHISFRGSAVARKYKRTSSIASSPLWFLSSPLLSPFHSTASPMPFFSHFALFRFYSPMAWSSERNNCGDRADASRAKTCSSPWWYTGNIIKIIWKPPLAIPFLMLYKGSRRPRGSILYNSLKPRSDPRVIHYLYYWKLVLLRARQQPMKNPQ